MSDNGEDAVRDSTDILVAIDPVQQPSLPVIVQKRCGLLIIECQPTRDRLGSIVFSLDHLATTDIADTRLGRGIRHRMGYGSAAHAHTTPRQAFDKNVPWHLDLDDRRDLLAMLGQDRIQRSRLNIRPGKAVEQGASYLLASCPGPHDRGDPPLHDRVGELIRHKIPTPENRFQLQAELRCGRNLGTEEISRGDLDEVELGATRAA